MPAISSLGLRLVTARAFRVLHDALGYVSVYDFNGPINTPGLQDAARPTSETAE